MAGGAAATYLCWGALAVAWVTGSATTPRDRSRTNEGDRDTASRAAGALAVVTLLSPRAWWRAVTVHSGAVSAAGIMIQVPATVFTLWARVRLGTMWSSAPTTKAAHELRTDGPYRVTRHPIYSGIIAMLVGTALVQGLGRWLVLVAAVVAAVIAKVVAEERLLAREFPVAYCRYRDEVPRLVPRIRARGH